jgi:nitrous oxide reductase accessory protein NosL
MYPARYPEHRCQIMTGDGKTHHFCSSQCLVNFLANPKEYLKKDVKAKSVWVTIPQEQSYEYAMGLYYLVGSSITGPMGKEAIPYRSKAVAEAAASKHGGKIVRFNKLTPLLINR